MDRRNWMIVGGLALGTACSPSYTTDSGVFRVYVPGMVDVTDTGGELSAHVEQTTTCVDQVDREAGIGSLEEGCWELQAVDNTIVDEACVTLGTPGTAVWEVRDNCADTGLDSDTITVEVVAVSAAQGTIDTWAEDLAVSDMISAEGSWPTDWLPADGSPWQLMGGEPFELQARLTDSDGRRLAWATADAQVWSEATSGSAPSVELSDAGELTVTVTRGSEATVGLTLFGADIVIADVIGVAPSAAASLELVAALVEDGTFTEQGTTPYAARAIVRDSAGQPIFGAPVRWSIAQEELGIDPGPGDLPGADYALLLDECAEPQELGGNRTAVLQASFSGLSDAVELNWMRYQSFSDLPEDVQEDMLEQDYERPSECDYQSGCMGCAGSGSPSGAWLALWASLTGLLRRRR